MYRLETLGYSIGQKLIEMISCRDRATKRETRLVGMLQYVSNVLWKHLFGKAADNLERSMENEDECRFHRLTLSLPRCISPPAHTQHPTPPPFLDCCRYDSRELTSNEHVRVCPRGYGPFELCCLHRGHHRRCLGQCTLRTSTPPLRSAVVANLTHFPVISFLIVWCIERKGYRALGGVGDWYRPHHFLSQIRTRGTRVSDPVVAS